MGSWDYLHGVMGLSSWGHDYLHGVMIIFKGSWNYLRGLGVAVPKVVGYQTCTRFVLAATDCSPISNYHLISAPECLVCSCPQRRGCVQLRWRLPFMKPQQLEVAVALVEGRHIFCSSPMNFGNKAAYHAVVFDKHLKKERGWGRGRGRGWGWGGWGWGGGLFHHCGCVSLCGRLMRDEVRCRYV